MSSGDAHAAAQREMANALYAEKGYADWDYAHELAGICLTAFTSSEAVRAALVDVGGTGLVKDWNRRPYVGQTAQEDAEAVVDAILAALAAGEAM